MLELFHDYLLGLLNEVANPQKRVFAGYLFTAAAIAMLWLCVVEKTSPKTAVKKIFDKRIWFSKSSLADFKIILINRVVMSAGAAAVVSQLTISTILYDLLHKQTLIQPLAFHATSASMVAILFTAFFFIFDDFSRFFVHRLMHRIPFLWAFHQVHHSAETMTPFTIFRTHPVEGLIFILRTSIVQGIAISVFIFLFGSKVDLVTIFGASAGVVIFHSLGSNLRHSHIKIRYPKILEHIFISDVPKVVSELFSLAKKLLIINVACYEAAALLPNGENAHITTRNAHWWKGVIDATAVHFEDVEVMLICSTSYASGVVYEPFRSGDWHHGAGFTTHYKSVTYGAT